MCTLIVIRKSFPNYPLVVASNRDERPNRPSSDPEYWPEHQSNTYAPRDLVRQGTWIGVSTSGMFAAITNRGSVTHHSGKQSRGQLVASALRHPSAVLCVKALETVSGLSFNGFHLVVMDRTSAFLVIGNGSRLDIETLSPGLHVITGYGTEPGHCGRAKAIEDEYRQSLLGGDPDPGTLQRMLSFHAKGSPSDAACVHDPNETHKTVSSMIIRARKGWNAFETWFRNGPACSGPFGPMTTIELKKWRRH